MKKIKSFIVDNSTIIMVSFIVLLLFKNCSTSKVVNDLNVKIVNMDNTIDSLQKKTISNKEVIDNMEKVMLDYLIYEDELDSKKITASQIKDKIESND